MKRILHRGLSLALSLLFLFPFVCSGTALDADRLGTPVPAERSRDFDAGWKFHLGEVSGAEAPGFSDSAWRSVTLPHDYSIEQDYTKSAQGESGYLPGGIGWYRKTFTVPQSDAGKRLLLQFDEVYMNSTTYLNGKKLGDHPYGYSPFSFDITDLVKVGEPNVLAVRVNNKLPSSRWYSGSGIYRDVKLTVTEPVHLVEDGIVVTTPNLKATKGTDGLTAVVSEVKNDSTSDVSIALRQTLTGSGVNKTLRSAPVMVAKGSDRKIKMELPVASPALWTPDTPTLYTLKTEVLVDGAITDTVEQKIGYKWTDVSNTQGLFLNGKPIKIKGVCMHHDQGALGAVANRTAQERQLQILKQMGCNAIRTSHNPASKEFVEMCDEYGFLVSDEIYDGWHAAKNGNFHDFSESFYKTIPADSHLSNAYAGETWAEYSLKSTIRRDRNRVSVYNWDLGNEVEGAAAGIAYDRDCKKLIGWTKEEDDTRILSTADSLLKYYNMVEVPDHTNIAKMQTAAGGMVGGNYVHGEVFDAIHKKHPEWCLYASEDASAINSRGIYKRGKNPPKHELTSYDEKTVSWGKMAASAWYDSITRDFVAGEYVWTGFDYIGEPTPWNSEVTIPRQGWPAPKSSYFGIVDLAGFPKDSYYFYMSQWNEKVNTLHVLPQWNENVVDKDKNGKVKVVVYSSAPSVELFFTPKGSTRKVSLGKKSFTTKKSNDGLYTYQAYEGKDKSKTDYENLYLSWDVPYADGTVSAVAYDRNGDILTDTVGTSSVTTTGPAQKLSAQVYGNRSTISADGKDLAYVEVTITDSQGRMVPDACNRITVKVNGKAVKLVAVDNGDAADMQRFQDDNRKAFNGRFLAIVQSTGTKGTATVTVSADGLVSDSVTITAN